jgi:hypothetical protein
VSSVVQLIRAHALLVHAKFAGHCDASVHAVATQRAVVVLQCVPSEHVVSSTQPSTHALAPAQLHSIGSQICFGTVQLASVVQSPAIVLHAPQPRLEPGAAQLPVLLAQVFSAEQQMPDGQPSAGHIAGSTPLARHPRYVVPQPQPSQMSGAHDGSRRQSWRSRPVHAPFVAFVPLPQADAASTSQRKRIAR